jgi:hypothetical protein
VKITRIQDEILYEQEPNETEEHFRASVRTHMAEEMRRMEIAAREYYQLKAEHS